MTETFSCSMDCLAVVKYLIDLQDEENEYRMDGFVVGDDEVFEEETERRPRKGEGSKKLKRLRKGGENDLELADDEDLELIREAQGVR